MSQDNEEFTTLFDILSLRRGCFGEGERELITKYIIPTGATCDSYGNYYLRIGNDPVMWSCHTDTVHEASEKGRQRLLRGADYIGLAEDDTCLGADNGAGVWLMLEMIKAGKQGLYVFHRNEEHGGAGSRYAAMHNREKFQGIQFAIAFDRRGTDSIITHQCWQRCCSDRFARALRDHLGIAGMRLDDGGVFTDTANYVDIIPECTNLSVGFYWEHTPQETLNLMHLRKLREAILALDINELPVIRDPSVEIDEAYGSTVFNNKDFLLANMELVYEVLNEWGCADIMADEVQRRL